MEKKGLISWTDDIYVVAMRGKFGTGKDYVVDAGLLAGVEQSYGHKGLKIAFADQLKLETRFSPYYFSLEEAYGPKTLRTRQTFQQHGDHMRQQRGDDYYVECLKSTMYAHYQRGIRLFFIGDARTKCEMEFIRNLPHHFVVQMMAPRRHLVAAQKLAGEDEKALNVIMNHNSETTLSVEDSNWDVLIKNDFGDEQDLPLRIQQVVGMITKRFYGE